MSERPGACVYFARLLPEEVRGEEQVLRWLHDEEIDRVVAFLEVWNENTARMRDDYWGQLGHNRRYFTRDGRMTNSGYSRHHEAERNSPQEAERMQETADRLASFSNSIRWIERLIKYAREADAGTLTLQEADRPWNELVEDSGV